MRITALLVGLMVSGCWAKDAAANHDNFSWHGFVAQGLTSSVDSDYITADNKVSAELTEVGLNATYVVGPSLSIAGQVVYLDGGNRFRRGARVDYLFADLRLTQFSDWQINVHLGRYKNRHWLYSATQDVPHTRPSITLPQSIYYDGNRDIALSSDGIAVLSTKTTDNGTLDIRWSYGRSPLVKEDTKKLLSPDVEGRIKQDYTHQFSVYWQPPSMNWQIGASLLSSEFNYEAAPQDILLNGSSQIDRVTLAARYDSENWEFTMELLRDRLMYAGDLAMGISLDVDNTGEGGYVQWRYFLQHNLTGLIRFDTYDVNRHDRQGDLLAQNPFGPIPSHYGYMDMVTVGLSWDIASQVRLSGEYSRAHGAGRLATVMFPNGLVESEPYWSAWSLQLMYWF